MADYNRDESIKVLLDRTEEKTTVLMDVIKQDVAHLLQTLELKVIICHFF